MKHYCDKNHDGNREMMLFEVDKRGQKVYQCQGCGAFRWLDETPKTYRTGYMVYLFGQKYWHRTLAGARRRSRANWNWCNGEHNQIVRVTDAAQMAK